MWQRWVCCVSQTLDTNVVPCWVQEVCSSQFSRWFGGIHLYIQTGSCVHISLNRQINVNNCKERRYPHPKVNITIWQRCGLDWQKQNKKKNLLPGKAQTESDAHHQLWIGYRCYRYHHQHTGFNCNILSCNSPVHQKRASFLQALTESIIQQLFMLSINITSRYSIKGRDAIKDVSKTGGKLWTAKCSLTATPSKDEIYVYKVGPHQIWVPEPSHQSN